MRRNKTRRIVFIALLSSLTVIANLITSVTIPLYAGTAMVIISGIALGPKSGFIVGVTARFICNFYQGQGVWTIWQMACWGILGVLAGIVFAETNIYKYGEDKNSKKFFSTKIQLNFKAIFKPIAIIFTWEFLGMIHFLITHQDQEPFLGYRIYVFGLIGFVCALIFSRKTIPVENITLSLFTFISVFIVYGGFINAGTLFMISSMNESGVKDGLDEWKMFFISGVLFDFMHAVGSSVTIFFVGKLIIIKIQRVKVKYGL